jgi:hypothetical protein
VTEPAPQPPPPETTHPARDPELEAARRNVLLGIGMFVLFVILFVATIVVAIIYNAYD